MTTAIETQQFQMLIGGQWVSASDGETMTTSDPYTGRVWATMPRAKAEDADRAVEAASHAFRGAWGQMTASMRGRLMLRLADLIERDVERLAHIEVRDNGKLITEMRAQVGYLPQYFRYFAGLADKIEGAVLPIDKADMFTYTRLEPLGVCVAITAWNSPLLLAVNKLAPGLAAGNTFVVKPSEFTSVSALELGRLAQEAGFPDGVINVVTGYGKEVGARLVEHPDVAKVAFTGSEFGGQHIYQQAARDFKHVTLELGGKSANIVFADANLDNAVKGAVSGIFAATGQTCVAGSRLLVQDHIYDEFLERLVAFAKKARMGNPQEDSTQVGPVTTPPPNTARFLTTSKSPKPKALVVCSVVLRPVAPSAGLVSSSSPRSSRTSTTRCASHRRRSLVPSSAAFAFAMTTKPWRSPTTVLTDSPPASGLKTCAAPLICRSD